MERTHSHLLQAVEYRWEGVREEVKEYYVFDFDKTVYDGDSSIDFFLFCIRHNLKCIRILPGFFQKTILYKLNRTTKESLKESFFEFLQYLDNPEAVVLSFWESHKNKIKPFFSKRSHVQDMIISASPEFLLNPICKELNVDTLIASEVDISTGKFNGKNCSGEEKYKRMVHLFGESIKIVEFYSDSDVDIPLAKRAEKAWKVKKNTIKLWHLEDE